MPMLAGVHVWQHHLADLLREQMPLETNGFHIAPQLDHPFWSQAVDKINGLRGAHAFWESVALALASHSEAPPAPRSPAALAALAAELERIDVSAILDGRLFLSDFSARQSELALNMLQIERIVVITSACTAGATWLKDCRSFFSVSPLQPLLPQLTCALHFMRSSRQPCLVCSDDGHGLAALLCAAFIATQEGLSASSAIERVEARRGPIAGTDAHLETFRALVESYQISIGDRSLLTHLSSGEGSENKPLEPSSADQLTVAIPASGPRTPPSRATMGTLARPEALPKGFAQNGKAISTPIQPLCAPTTPESKCSPTPASSSGCKALVCDVLARAETAQALLCQSQAAFAESTGLQASGKKPLVARGKRPR